MVLRKYVYKKVVNCESEAGDIKHEMCLNLEVYFKKQIEELKFGTG
jgi:uncharacterized protein Yka (UPF0111/DUF47 family)